LTLFNEYEEAVIRCSLSQSLNKDLIKNITWIKDNSTQNLIDLEDEIEFLEDKLIFKNLSRNKFDGVYECMIILIRDQIRSSNKIDVLTLCKF
jgi:hypothetical protein